MVRTVAVALALRLRLNVHQDWDVSPTVPVSGPVSISYDYDVGGDLAVVGLRLYCRAAAGSRPRYRWFLNQTLLRERGSFYYVVNRPPEGSILLLSVGRRSAGTYRCEVADGWDDSGAVSSPRLFASKEGTSAPAHAGLTAVLDLCRPPAPPVLNGLPLLVVAAVFGSFALLLVMVFACCLTGALLSE